VVVKFPCFFGREERGRSGVVGKRCRSKVDLLQKIKVGRSSGDDH
jgi:hypothetical protein